MTQTNEKRTDWLVTAPDDEDFLKSLQAACYNNEHAAKILSHMLYLAKYEADRQQLPKGCKVVTFSRKLNDIIAGLKKLNYNISKKTLIRYFDLFNIWEYIASQRYGREFAVSIENIQQAVNHPPTPPERKKYDRHPQKSCRSTTLQHSENEPVETEEETLFLREKVVTLQLKVEELQLKGVELQHKVDKLQLYTFESACLEKRLEEGNSDDPLLNIINKLITNRIKDIIITSDDVTTTTASLQKELEQERERRQQVEERLATLEAKFNTVLEGGKRKQSYSQGTTEKTTRKRPGKAQEEVKQEALPVVEPDLSFLSEQEREIYGRLRDEDKPKYLKFLPEVRTVYMNWLGIFGFATTVALDITPKVEECLTRLAPLQPSTELLKKKRQMIKKLDQQRSLDKQFFKGRQPQIWDVVRKWTDIDVTEENQQSGDLTPPPSTQQACMTHDEACKLAQDAIEEAKQYNITIAAQAFSSKNNPDIWGVRVKWDDGSESGFPFPVVKVRGQWDMTLTEIRKIIKEEAKQAARSVARMQEAK